MPLTPDTLRSQLDSAAAHCGRPARVLLAWSGGRDSTVLLHLLHSWSAETGIELLVLHVNHGLQACADGWEAHCEQLAKELGVSLQCFHVRVDNDGLGLEASARAARYAVLQSAMHADDWLLTAHHEDDQAETVLLNLMRGSGIRGLRGTAVCRRLERGFLVRPLLAVSGRAIADYAVQHKLVWIDDHSNANQRHDRNYLRGTVLPALRDRWPQAARSLARSAAHATEAAVLLNELASSDIAACGSADRLSMIAMARLSAARQRNLVRTACEVLNLNSPPYNQLYAIQNDLLNAGSDASPLVTWSGAEARRYRDHLYLLPTSGKAPESTGVLNTNNSRVVLAGHQGELTLRRSESGGIREQTVAAGLRVCFRQGGERVQPHGHGRRRRLKSLFQEAGVVPWMRDWIPLFYAGDELVAVGDLWIAAKFHEQCGFSVNWENKPAGCVALVVIHGLF